LFSEIFSENGSKYLNKIFNGDFLPGPARKNAFLAGARLCAKTKISREGTRAEHEFFNIFRVQRVSIRG